MTSLGKNAEVTRSKLMAAAAGILRDNHLLITGLWQGLTRVTDSRVPITLPICHVFAQHLNPFLPFRV